jgi:Rrf2 family protein
MKISARTEYACIAMVELASRYGSDEPVRIRCIAERHSVPPRFLVQILLQLKAAGLVASVRGASGGYRLARPPEDISLGQVIAAVDGAADLPATAAGISRDSPVVRVLMAIWQQIGDVERRMLEGVSLAELLQRAKGQAEKMYFI